MSDSGDFSEPQHKSAYASVERQVPCELCSARPHSIPPLSKALETACLLDNT